MFLKGVYHYLISVLLFSQFFNIHTFSSYKLTIKRNYIKMNMESKTITNQNLESVAPKLEWDEEKGVWKGDSAPSLDHSLSTLPDPLYLFGYGSLVWRPGDLLQQFPSFKCRCFGYKRLFAQRSTDHRGIPAFPGLVATLVHENHLIKVGLLDHLKDNLNIEVEEPSSTTTTTTTTTTIPSTSESVSNVSTIGVVYMIEDRTQINALIKELDYREKGGYQRHLIKLRLLEDTPHHVKGDIVQGLVYTGSEMNPNFFLPTDITSSSSSSSPLVSLDTSRLVDIITYAHGPSGPNDQYLFQLSAWFEENGLLQEDRHLALLNTGVKLRNVNKMDNSMNTGSIIGKPYRQQPQLRLLGWGSDQYKQITQPDSKGDNTFIPENEHDQYQMPIEIDIKFVSESIYGHGYGESEEEKGIQAETPSTDAEILDTDIDMKMEGEGVNRVYAGGAFSAILRADGHLMLWGCNDEGQLLSPSTTTTRMNGVKDVALGHAHVLCINDHGLLSWGDNSHGQTVVPAAISADKKDLNGATIQVQSISAGLRHSAAVTKSGDLYTWGSNKHHQCISSDSAIEDNLRMREVACGAKHTVCVSECGRVFIAGSGPAVTAIKTDNTDSMSDNGSNNLIEVDLTSIYHTNGSKVKWVHATTGWSHVIVRGVDTAGNTITAAWGRCDMGQIPFSSDFTGSATSISSGYTAPVQLASLPNGEFVHEVWCGSEFSAATNRYGQLFMTGWNEHGNLGIDSVSGSDVNGHKKSKDSIGWQPVSDAEGKQVFLNHYPMHRSFAAGGGHCLCLAFGSSSSIRNSGI